jgi:WD40 repeat protein
MDYRIESALNGAGRPGDGPLANYGRRETFPDGRQDIGIRGRERFRSGLWGLLVLFSVVLNAPVHAYTITRPIWETPTPTGPGGTVVSVEFSPDGTQILAGSRNGKAKIWDAVTGAEIRVFDGQVAPFSWGGAFFCQVHSSRIFSGRDPGPGRLGGRHSHALGCGDGRGNPHIRCLSL